MNKIEFEDYYKRVIKELKKNKERDKNYFDNLDLLVKTIEYNSDFDDIDKIDKLKCLVYLNGSLNEKEIENIDKEFGLNEESFR